MSHREKYTKMNVNMKRGLYQKLQHAHRPAATIFLNTILVIVFLLYFLFTPFLLIGLFKVKYKTLLTIKINFVKFLSVKSKLVHSLLDLRHSHDKPFRLFLHCCLNCVEYANVLALLHIFCLKAQFCRWHFFRVQG